MPAYPIFTEYTGIDKDFPHPLAWQRHTDRPWFWAWLWSLTEVKVRAWALALALVLVLAMAPRSSMMAP